MKIPSKDLVKLIKSLGINVSSHMSSLDDVELRLVKQAIDAELITQPDIKIMDTAPINRQELNESGAKGSYLDFVLDNSGFNNDNFAVAKLSATKKQNSEEPPLQGLEFSIDALKAAHPYIAVKTMYENGYPIREIAKLLGRGQGEVSLILNLSKKKPAVI